MKLFSEKLGLINTDEELTALIKKYPKYDAGYLCQATLTLRSKTRKWMEKIWKQYEPYADTQFLNDFRHQFNQRSWEMYLGATFLNRGFSLGPHKDAGPDFDLRDKNGKRVAWVEAIALTNGDGPDRVPEMRYNTVSDIPSEKIHLRIASGLDKKYNKYTSDIKNGYVKSNEPYIIAIDRSQIGHMDTLLPGILHALFGLGHLALRMRLNGERVENPESTWTRVAEIKKQSGAGVPMLFFENPAHAGISAVIYTQDNVINNPRGPKQMGENFTIVHNPLATTPLITPFFSFGDEHVAENGYIQRIRRRKSFRRQNPFSN